MNSTFNSILNRICTALFGDSWDKTLDFIRRLEQALQEKYSATGNLCFSLITLENRGGGMVAVNHSHFHQENGEWLKENARIDLPKSELPNHLRSKLSAAFGEVDITADVERELKLRKEFVE